MILARNFNQVRYAHGDRSFSGKPCGRRDLLEVLIQGGSMPECGIGETLRTHPDRKFLAEMELTGGDDPALATDLAARAAEWPGARMAGAVATRAEAYGKLAPVPFRDYAQEARELLEGLAVDRATFERWLHDCGYSLPKFLEQMAGHRTGYSPVAEAPATPRHGRPKGTRPYAELDAPLIAEGAQLVRDGTVPSVLAAAKQLAPQTEGASFEAKVDRLRRGIRQVVLLSNSGPKC